MDVWRAPGARSDLADGGLACRGVRDVEGYHVAACRWVSLEQRGTRTLERLQVGPADHDMCALLSQADSHCIAESSAPARDERNPSI